MLKGPMTMKLPNIMFEDSSGFVTELLNPLWLTRTVYIKS